MRSAALITFALAVPALAAQIPQVPRPAKELAVVEPSGKQTLVSSLKGKVVVIQFLATTCPHCQRYSQLLTRLQSELGSKGFQALGVAFNEATPATVAAYVKQFAVGIPVGHASRETVTSYLGLSPYERLAVPQIVVVDRKGVIRAQSEPLGSENLVRESYLRTLLTSLLQEGAGKAKAKAK
jgi:thiol-disulfide isomerase/thioredoxin